MEQGRDGGVVGLSNLQHPRVDPSALETTRSGGDGASVVKKGKNVV
jgi:hypothetical protein